MITSQVGKLQVLLHSILIVLCDRDPAKCHAQYVGVNSSDCIGALVDFLLHQDPRRNVEVEIALVCCGS